MARRRSSFPLPSPNLVHTHPIERYQALCDGAPCLSRAATPPEAHQIGARRRRAHGNIILNQPYRRRVSTDRLNCKGNQMAASLEGEHGPTPAGKTLPHSYPETRSRRERARGISINTRNRFISIDLANQPIKTLPKIDIHCPTP